MTQPDEPVEETVHYGDGRVKYSGFLLGGEMQGAARSRSADVCMRCRQLEMEGPIRRGPLHPAHGTSGKRRRRRRTSRVGYTGRNRLGSDEEDPVCAKVQPLGRCLHAVSSTGDGGSDSLWSIAPSAPNERITAYSTPNFSAWLHRTQRLGSHEEDRPRPGDVACGVVNWRWRDRFGAVHCTQRTERAENGVVDTKLLGLATPDATARLK